MNQRHTHRVSLKHTWGAVIAAAVAGICSGVVAADREPASGTVSSAATGAPALASKVTAEERVTGTVIAADPRAGTFDLVTGVGYALRVRRVHLPQPKPAAARALAAPRTPAPGTIVRVTLRQTASGAVADSVTVLEAPPRQVKP